MTQKQIIVRATAIRRPASQRGDLALVEHRLMTRLGGLVVVFTALHYWPAAH